MKYSKEDLVVYQVYIRSFRDTNGDGIGDLPGVIEKLDYIRSLGVNMIWLSPFCSSPNDDNGYDISDYRNVMPEYGTLSDAQRLIEEAHARGIGIMMDLVLNHTSDEHPWFEESRSSKDNPKRDYYLWGVGPDGGTPNNWDSYFGGSAWERDPRTGEYYCHLFSKKQPDLNWANPRVREEIYDLVEWWINQGVDAFRLDAIHLIGKPEGWPDAPGAYDGEGPHLHVNHPLTHTYLQELNSRVFSRHGTITVGETGGTTPETALLYVDKERRELDMIFHFGMLHFGNPDSGDFARENALWYKKLSNQGWDTSFLSNHDLPRHLSAFGNDEQHKVESAKLLAMYILTSWGTPFLYQGEELGMTNAGFTSIEDFRDHHSIASFKDRLGKDDDVKALDYLIERGRDNSRTPMHWDGSARGGFSSGNPWIGMANNVKEINAKKQEKDPLSVLNFYRKLIELRKKLEPLKNGDLKFFETGSDSILMYSRRHLNEELMILLNMSDHPAPMALLKKKTRVILGNYHHAEEKITGDILLKPWEALLLENSGQNSEDLALKQLKALIDGEKDRICLLANASAFLFRTMERINWAGFYLWKAPEGCLVLGPFQGKPACTRIRKNHGVCGTAFAEKKNLTVDDVEDFPGHISCDADSRSEMVVPLILENGEEIGVLDIDSPEKGRFNEGCREWIVEAARIITTQLEKTIR